MTFITDKYNEIWNTQRTEELAEVFLESAVYKDALQEGNAIDLLSLSIIETAKAFPNVTLEVVSTFKEIDDKHVVIEWLMKGKNTRSFFGAEPTNKEVEISGLDLIQIRGNKINAIKSYYDSNQFVTQLGL